MVDDGVTFEEDDHDFALGFQLFVNNPLFSDVALRVSDDRVYSGHRVLLMAGNPYFAAILRPLGWGSRLEAVGEVPLPEQEDEPDETMIMLLTSINTGSVDFTQV